MPERIIVIGVGFAGLWSALAAKRLINLHRRDDIEVVVVSPEPTVTLRPRLYETDPASKIASVQDLFRTTGVRFVRGKVDKIDTSGKEVDIIDLAGAHSTLSYDRLVLAAGSQLVHPNIPGLAGNAFNIDNIKEATRFDAHLRSLKDLPLTDARNTFVVSGAGPTGLELAAELPSTLRSILGPGTRTRVILVGRENDDASLMGPGPRPTIQKALAKLGVEVKLGSGVVSVDAGGLTLASGERIETLTTVWTAGVAPSPLTKQIDGVKDATGRLLVDRDLRVPANKAVFATGDTASAALDDAGNVTMMSCQHAMVLGRTSGHNAAADLLHLPTTRYWQPAYVTCLDLGPSDAVVTIGWDRKVVFTGAMAKKMKVWINGTLINPPLADDPAKALALADPASFSGLPADVSQRLIIVMMSTIAFFMSFIL